MTEQELWDLLRALPDPQPVFYRLYHDQDGQPLFYSMEDLPGTYIEIDAAAYVRNSMRVRVRDGRMIEVTDRVSEKLVPGDQGTACHPGNILIVVDQEPNQKWSRKIYETY
jgi:hypothetical protein